MIDKINTERHEHIITIEDPIEYLHPHKSCVVNQREVGADTNTFKKALKYILRQDPDVVLIGEMRDLETIEAALVTAETGHLVFATLHTNSAVQTINRIIDVFPPNQQSQIRAQLSFVLEGVISQSLMPKADGSGRVPALEIMIPNAAIRNLIREDKIHQIYSQMQIGQGKSGMQTLNQWLASLFLRRLISLEEALGHSADPDELQQIIAGGGAQGGRPGARRLSRKGVTDGKYRLSVGGARPQRRGEEGRDGGRRAKRRSTTASSCSCSRPSRSRSSPSSSRSASAPG